MGEDSELRIASLGSGSSGNATLIASPNSAILIDCGFACRELERRAALLGFSLSNLSAVLVTHEHGDHSKGVAALARKHNVPVYMSHGTHLSKDFGKLPQLEIIKADEAFQIDQFTVRAITVPHDAREPLQFVFEYKEARAGVLTDLGSLSELVIEGFSDCNALLVEANHDLNMLANGPYPPSLQARISGPWGHLNNRQTAELISRLDTEHLKCLIVGHISEKNNSLEKVKQELAEVTKNIKSVYYASQGNGTPWINIEI